MVAWLSIVLGLLPAIVWLVFFLQEDRRRPEPRSLILSTFIWGGLVTFVVLQTQIFYSRLVLPLGIKNFSPISIFVLAGLEELLKFLVVFLWVGKRKDFDEPIDAMVYMIVASLGFATVENVASVSRSVIGFELVTLRFIGANLLHALSSGLVGYYWARGLMNNNVGRSIAIGLFLATAIHSAFNGLVLIFGPALYVTVFLVFVGFFILHDFEKLKTPARQGF
jgi:RsiW-degrading membrane proteinase PrsW (M82 family)